MFFGIRGIWSQHIPSSLAFSFSLVCIKAQEHHHHPVWMTHEKLRGARAVSRSPRNPNTPELERCYTLLQLWAAEAQAQEGHGLQSDGLPSKQMLHSALCCCLLGRQARAKGSTEERVSQARLNLAYCAHGTQPLQRFFTAHTRRRQPSCRSHEPIDIRCLKSALSFLLVALHSHPGQRSPYPTVRSPCRCRSFAPRSCGINFGPLPTCFLILFR